MQNKKCKTVLFLCGTLLIWNIQAQVGRWKTHTAYFQATQVVETPNLVFGIYDGSLLSYNPEDGEIRTYSSQEGLSDADIQVIAYHPGEKALIIVYTNANIDIFLGENDVYNIGKYKLEPFNNKTIYNLDIIGNYAYLSTGFGIVVIDVKRKEIKDRYRLGDIAVRSVCQKGNYLYAATPEGIKKALITSNLLDGENWKLISDELTTYNFTDAKQLFLFKNQLVIYVWDMVFYVEPNKTHAMLDLHGVRGVKLLNDQLVVLTGTDIYFYSDFTNYTSVPLSANSIDCINSKNQYWLASGEAGLSGFIKTPDPPGFKETVSEIKINSPKRNINFFMTFMADKLLVTGGGKDMDRKNIEGALMVYENGKWYNFNSKAISDSTGLPCLDFVSVTVDPADPNHYFVGSWGEGLYEFKNNEFVKLYSFDNSSLQTANPQLPFPDNRKFIRVDGMVFDKNNNLYMVNAAVTNGLSIFINQKEWKNFNYSPLVSSDPDRIVISRNNQKWFNFYRGSRSGIMVLDENATIGDSSDDKVAYSGSFSDQQGVDIEATTYITMAEDQNGLIWVGTDNGPIYFTSMEQVERGVCNRIISTDKNGEGFRPLEGIKITAIAVDGGNRKWMGSAGSGVFILDQSQGPETRVDNFTVENSPLLSNNISSLAINSRTGEVFIGTDKGICSYQSEAIEGKPDYSEVYAYPNPVRPASNNQVIITGLMQNSNVKITDLTGNLIKEGVSLGGQYTWNCTDRTGTIVKAGIYLVFASTPDGNQGVVTKIMVIK